MKKINFEIQNFLLNKTIVVQKVYNILPIENEIFTIEVKIGKIGY